MHRLPLLYIVRLNCWNFCSKSLPEKISLKIRGPRSTHHPWVVSLVLLFSSNFNYVHFLSLSNTKDQCTTTRNLSFENIAPRLILPIPRNICRWSNYKEYHEKWGTITLDTVENVRLNANLQALRGLFSTFQIDIKIVVPLIHLNSLPFL